MYTESEPDTIWLPSGENEMQLIGLLAVIVSNGIVIVPLVSEIDGIKGNWCLQCVQTGEC